MTPRDFGSGSVRRLVLEIARDTVTQTHLKTLLTVAKKTISDHRRELRTVKAQLARQHVRIAGLTQDGGRARHS
jgi:hypothetical protein